MKKAWTALLWLGLMASVIALFVVLGQFGGLRESERNAVLAQESLQAQYAQLQKEIKALSADSDALRKENALLSGNEAALKLQLAELSQSLQTARSESAAKAASERQTKETYDQERQDWEQQVRTLTAEKNAAASCLTEALAVLMPAAEPTPGTEADNLFAAQRDSGFEPADDPEPSAQQQKSPAAYPHPADKPGQVFLERWPE